MLQRVRRSLLFIAVFAICASLASGAVVHGTTYEWSTFEPLENTIVEVDGAPPQFLVASSGSYSFDLPEGTYTIRAAYYQENLLEYYAEENITIVGDGDFVLDLLMFPPIEEEFLYEDINFSEDLYDYEEPDKIAGEDDSLVSPVLIAIFFVLIAGFALFLWRRKRSESDVKVAGVEDNRHEPHKPEMELQSEMELEPEPEFEGADDEESEIPSDLQEVLSAIRDDGGRISQKELRARLKYSEAKVSLMITDLEDRGLVKKVKKGRGNVIILKGSMKNS
jgi:uncharacterized membrane protein